MHEFLYNYIKPKYEEKRQLYYMNTYSFIVPIKQKMFLQALQKILKQNLILPITKLKNHSLE